RLKELEGKVARQTAAAPAGKAVSSEGKVVLLSKAQADAVKAVIGRKRSGTVADALAMFELLPASLGNEFTVQLKGRKTSIVFVTDPTNEGGVEFDTLSARK